MSTTTPESGHLLIAFGGEAYLLDEVASRSAQPSKAHRVVTLSGEGGVEPVLAALEQRGVDDLPVVVVVDDAQIIKASPDLKAWSDRTQTRASLVAVCRSETLPAFWASLKTAKRIERPKFKPFSKDLPRWVAEQAKKRKVKLSEKQVAALVENLGHDLRILSGELTKLALVVSPDCEVSPENFARYVVGCNEVTPYNVAENVAERSPAPALKALSRLVDREGEACLVPVVVSTTKLLEKLLLASALQSKKTPPDEIAARVDVHPWRYKTWLVPLALKRSAGEYRSAFRVLADLDVDVKTLPRSRLSRVESALVELSLLEGCSVTVFVSSQTAMPFLENHNPLTEPKHPWSRPLPLCA